jgi:hypothetical protein
LANFIEVLQAEVFGFSDDPGALGERWADQISKSGTFGVARSLELQIRQSSPVTASTPEVASSGAHYLP